MNRAQEISHHCPAATSCLRRPSPKQVSIIDDIAPTNPYNFVEAWEETQEVGGTAGLANLQAPQEDSVPIPASPSAQQI